MKKYLIILIICGIATIANAATPTINNVSGTVSSGQTLTITGTNMVNQADGDYSANCGSFEGSSCSTDGWNTVNGDAAYDSSVKLLGNKSFRSDISGSGSSNCPYDNQFGDSIYRNMSHYVRLYVYFSSGFNDIWASAAYTKMVEYISPTQVYVQPQSRAGGPTTMWTQITGGKETYMNLPERWVTGRWYCVEYSISSNGLTVWVDGVQIGTLSGSVNMGAMTPQIGLINACPVKGSGQMYVDGVMSNSSRVYPASTIEISGDGGATWKYQPPVSLSDSSAKIMASLPALSASSYLLRVKNNQQQTSAIYNLSGGGSQTGGGGGQATDGTPPSKPSGVSASSISSSQINISWSSSSDNVAVIGYKVYRDGVYIATSTKTSYSDNGLSEGTYYSYNISAIDAAGNESNKSSSVGATTQEQVQNIPNPPGSGTTGTGTSAGTVLKEENFNDSNFGARGWYDETNHGTVVSGGKSGNCLQWAWSSGDTAPTNGGAMRMQFTPTDSLYVSFYVKFQDGWRGSQQNYHPHLMYILSDLDNNANAYSPLATNYLNTYIEFLSDVGSPYSIRPHMMIQDSLRVNANQGTLPNDLSATTENRSVAYCNSRLPSDVDGTCYSVSGIWYSSDEWTGSSTVSTNLWHHVEVYLKMNTIKSNKGQADGTMLEFIDGAKVIDRSDVLYRTSQDATKKWAQFVLAPYIGDGAPIAEKMWIDELTIGTGVPDSGSSVVVDEPNGLRVVQ